MSMIKF